MGHILCEYQNLSFSNLRITDSCVGDYGRSVPCHVHYSLLAKCQVVSVMFFSLCCRAPRDKMKECSDQQLAEDHLHKVET